MDLARTGDLFKPAFSLLPDLLVQAIDPATGDQLLHVATQLASLDAINKILGGFGPDRHRFYIWARHAIIVHQNHDGDTALHVAARSGNQLLLTMLYRYSQWHWSARYPEEMDMDDRPPEHNVYPVDIEEQLAMPSLLLLITKNNIGRDPAAEARHAGNHDLAQWLDDVVLRLDGDGTLRTEAKVAEMIEYVKGINWYEFIESRQQQQQQDNASSTVACKQRGRGLGNAFAGNRGSRRRIFAPTSLTAEIGSRVDVRQLI